MEERVGELIGALADIRKVPQFLFCDSIWPWTTVEVRKKIREYQASGADCSELDFIINSPGGSPSDAYRIIRALRGTFNKVNIIVPFWAKSAATLLALGGSQIVMNDWAEFGPIDIQVAKPKDDSPEFDYESALNDEFSLRLLESRSQELFKTMFVDLHRSKHVPLPRNELSQHIMGYLPKFFAPLLTQINPYKLGEKKRQLAISVSYAHRILLQYNSLEKNDRATLIDYLLHDCPDHGYVVDFSLISAFLKNVYRGNHFGAQFADTLDDLSLFFMDEDDGLSYIGFIDAPQKVSPSDDSGIKNADESVSTSGVNGSGEHTIGSSIVPPPTSHEYQR